MIALWLLWMIGCSGKATTLITELSSENPVVRQDALIEARDFSDAALTAAVEKLLTDPDPRIRYEAVITLYQFRSTTSVQPLLPILYDTDPKVSRAAIDTLGHLADPSAASALMTLVSTNRDHPPLNAIWALGQCKVKEGRALLSELRQHPDKWVRYNVDEALRHIDE